MEALIYFALWAVLFFLMMRAGCGSHVAGQSHRSAAEGSRDAGDENFRWNLPEKDTDPVCGKVVRTVSAKPSVHGGRIYHFCSRDCREIFEAAPELYLGGGDHDHKKMEHSHA